MVFDATSAYVHVRHYKQYAEAGIVAVDLTPAARGPKVIAAVNLTEHLDAPNVNMVTCGGQATTPMVYAVRRAVESLPYAEMVSTVSSQVGGPGDAAEHRRVHQDHVARRCGRSAARSCRKAIIILNPAEPPIMMRNTVFAGAAGGHRPRRRPRIGPRDGEGGAARTCPGYRLKNPPVIEEGPFHTPGGVVPHRAVVLLEVEGAGDYLPPYAGNLDIMTAAAQRVGEAIAHHKTAQQAGAQA